MPKKSVAPKASSKNGRPPGLSKKAQRERIEKIKREQGVKPPAEEVFAAMQRDLALSEEEYAKFMRVLKRLRK